MMKGGSLNAYYDILTEYLGHDVRLSVCLLSAPPLPWGLSKT